jgi:hypothetical protein
VGRQAGGCAGAAAGFVAADYAAGFRRWMRVCHGGSCDVCGEIDGWGLWRYTHEELLKVSNIKSFMITYNVKKYKGFPANRQKCQKGQIQKSTPSAYSTTTAIFL